MPVLAVKSDGVSFEMSFICGLSTIATLIVFDLLDEPPPLSELPQPAAIAPIVASTANVQPARDQVRAEVLLMVALLLWGDGEMGLSPLSPTMPCVHVGCQAQTAHFSQDPHVLGLD